MHQLFTTKQVRNLQRGTRGVLLFGIVTSISANVLHSLTRPDAAGEPQWRVVPGSRFRWREWDGEFVLYHENSGDTHRLNALGARALAMLGASPVGTAELSERLAHDFDLRHLRRPAQRS